MLTRLYIDNFRCFVNFEYRPAAKELILGRNGSGKSSLMDALLFLRQVVMKGDEFDSFFVQGKRTRWLSQNRTTYELGVELDGGRYQYRLAIESSGEPPRSQAIEETLHVEGKPIFEFTTGLVQPYSDRFEPKATYEIDSNRSALATIIPRADNQRLTRFKQWLSSFYCFRINPFAMSARAEGENLYPNVDLSNVAAWYKHLVQADPKSTEALRASLRESIEGFQFFQLEPYSDNVRLMRAEFSHGSKTRKFYLHELSDGQRCLIALYTILHFVLAKGGTVILDEPENFISLREIQPWLTAVADAIEESGGQIILISHHPEIINQWAPSNGVQFVRDSMGSVRVEKFRGDPQSSLAPAELIARGWESE